MKWHENEFHTFHYYDEETGLIVGLTHKIGTQNSIYIARIMKDNTEYSLGQYINQDFARKAIERYWDIENRTLLN